MFHSGVGLKKSLAIIDSARTSGIDIVHDLYPYTASSTGSSILFPQWSTGQVAKKDLLLALLIQNNGE